MEARKRRKWGLMLSAASVSIALACEWRLHQITERLKLSTPLVEAAEAGNYASAQRLLAQGADPNAVATIKPSLVEQIRDMLHLRTGPVAARDLRPALFWAIARGHNDIVKLLLDNGADVSRTDQNGLTVIYAAASWGNMEALQLLMTHGANPDGGYEIQRDVFYLSTPLDIAAIHGKTEAIRFLLEQGADPNFAAHHHVPVYDTPLTWAVTKNYPDCVRLLLAHGADPNYQPPRGGTAIGWAKRLNSRNIEKLLLDAGAKP